LEFLFNPNTTVVSLQDLQKSVGSRKIGRLLGMQRVYRAAKLLAQENSLYFYFFRGLTDRSKELHG
jgi:hypothetical protein